MSETSEGHRQQLLDALRRFVSAVRQIAGVRRIAVLGSIVTTKPDPKDVDVLVVVADDADLTANFLFRSPARASRTAYCKPERSAHRSESAKKIAILGTSHW
jgi:hypothetical protein